MNINYELYRIFYTVALNGSISKAANELYISQPAVSKSIKKLEDELGGAIFKRTKAGVTLTEEGKELFKYVKNGMEYLNNAEVKFKDLIKLESGKIRIGINTTLVRQFLLPYLKEFHKLHPKIIIEICTGNNNYLINRLKNGFIDIMVLNLPFTVNDDIKIIECKKVQDCFCVNKDFKELIHNEVSIKVLEKYPIILQSKGSNTRDFLDNYLNKMNINITPSMSLTSFSLVKDFTINGFGIGYLTKEYIKKELENKELYLIKTKESIPKRSIGIAYSNSVVSFSANELIKIITSKKNS